MDQISLVVILLAAVAILVEVAERIGVPYPIVLVLGGLALAVIPGLPPVNLPPELILLVFIPPLVLSAAVLTPLAALRNNISPTLRLSVGLVLFTIGVVAVIFHEAVPSLGWIGAVALGAIVSPTDTLAATTILNRLRVPPRLVAILEAESLFNDGTALVIYRSAVLAAAGASVALGDVAIGVAVAVVGAVVLGIVVAFISTKLFRRLEQPPVIVALTLVTPYVAYLPADRLGFSGIIAVVVAGVALSRWSTRVIAPETRVLATATWEMVVLLLNGFAFILIGLALPTVLHGLGERTPAHLAALALLAAGAVVLARLAWFFVTTFAPWSALKWPGPRPAHARIAYTFVPGWAGLRGAVSLAAALSLPTTFPERDLIIFLTFVVILVTLVGQGLTLPLLVERFGLRQPSAPRREEADARAAVIQAGLAEIERMRPRWPTHQPLLDRLQAGLDDRTSHLATDSPEETAERRQERREHEEIQTDLIQAQRNALIDLRDDGRIDDDLLRVLLRELDLEELRMEA